MTKTAQLTIDLTPELRDHLFQISEKKQVSPSRLAAEILQCFLQEEVGRSRLDDGSGSPPVERRRRSRPACHPEAVVADIQRSLEALGDYLPGFNSGDPLAAEVEAIISRVEAGRAND